MAKLLGFVINTGALTRYYSFHPTSSLIPYSHFIQYVFVDCFDYGGVANVVLSILYLTSHPKYAAMQDNFIFLSIEFLFPKRMIDFFFEDKADQWFRFKYTSTHS